MMNGETITSGAAAKCSDCGVELDLKVMHSGGGFYLGTECHCGPYSRESGYFGTHEEALHELRFEMQSDWQRDPSYKG